MRRLIAPTAAALLAFTGCATSETGLSVQDELTLTAVQGEEEDLTQGEEGDFSSGCMNGPRGDDADVDRPELFRFCDAEGSLADLTEKYDSDGDGDLDVPERDEVWEARGERPDHHEARRNHRWMRLVRIYDTDRDRELSEEERLVMLDDFSVRCEVLHEQALADFDADGDGELSDEEREAAREAARERRGERRDTMLQEYDINGDGEITREEGRAMHEARRAEMEERRAACLDAYDVDGDGEWSDEEHAAFVEAMRERVTTGQNLRCTE
ncbi:MAG: hypothetical protein GY898_26745 [Proteobacteria bacterium]|nr:hypothetical protein [Pseudomonadota bacterium]